MLPKHTMKAVPAHCCAAAAVLAFTGCSSVTVTTDHDPAAPFGRYHTYTLTPAAKRQTLSPSSEAALRNSLNTSLAARGIHEVPGKGDVDVVPHVFSQEKVSVQEYTDWGYGYHGSWPYGYGHYGMWAGAPRTYVDVNQYTEGTLVLDFIDARTQKLVFRGVGKAVVSGPQSNAEKVREAVEKIVEKFPGGAAH